MALSFIAQDGVGPNDQYVSVFFRTEDRSLCHFLHAGILFRDWCFLFGRVHLADGRDCGYACVASIVLDFRNGILYGVNGYKNFLCRGLRGSGNGLCVV